MLQPIQGPECRASSEPELRGRPWGSSSPHPATTTVPLQAPYLRLPRSPPPVLHDGSPHPASSDPQGPPAHPVPQIQICLTSRSSESTKTSPEVRLELPCPCPGCPYFLPNTRISRLCSYIRATPLATAWLAPVSKPLTGCESSHRPLRSLFPFPAPRMSSPSCQTCLLTSLTFSTPPNSVKLC